MGRGEGNDGGKPFVVWLVSGTLTAPCLKAHGCAIFARSGAPIGSCRTLVLAFVRGIETSNEHTKNTPRTI